MKGLLVVLAFLLLAPVAAAGHPPPPGVPPPPPSVRVPFFAVGSNLSPASVNRKLGSSSLRNHISIVRSRKEAKGWNDVLDPADQTAVHDNYFPRFALTGVFFRRGDAQSVRVAGMSVSGDSLELSLELVPWPVFVCVRFLANDGGCPWATFLGQRSLASYPYTLVAVDKAALASVSRVVVTSELYDAPVVVNISPQ